MRTHLKHWGEIGVCFLMTDKMPNGHHDRNLCALVRPHIAGVFSRLIRWAHMYATGLYKPSSTCGRRIMIHLPLSALLFSLYLHAPSLLTCGYFIRHYCDYSKPIMFPVMFYCQFWLDLQRTLIAALCAKEGKCGRITRDRRATASLCWIPQSDMQPFQRFYVEGWSSKTQTFQGWKCWVVFQNAAFKQAHLSETQFVCVFISFLYFHLFAGIFFILANLLR